MKNVSIPQIVRTEDSNSVDAIRRSTVLYIGNTFNSLLNSEVCDKALYRIKIRPHLLGVSQNTVIEI